MKKNVKIAEKYSRFLKNDKYFFNSTYSKLSNQNKDKITDVTDFSNGGTGIKRALDKIINDVIIGKELIINSDRKIFDGNVLLIPSHRYGVKIFNDDEVLTYYNNKEFLKNDLKKREKIGEIVNTPKIKKITENYLIEEKIKNIEFEKEEALISIMKKYIDFFSNRDVKILEKNIKNKKHKILFYNFYKKIAVNKKDYKCILQHGDLWYGNIIYDGNIYVVDYEEVEEKYFLYDFFKYIYSEAFISSNYKLLNNFFSGKYDEILNIYFSALNMNYNLNQKKEYFFTFLNVFIEDRIKTNNLYTFKKEIDLIKNVIKHIQI